MVCIRVCHTQVPVIRSDFPMRAMFEIEKHWYWAVLKHRNPFQVGHSGPKPTLRPVRFCSETSQGIRVTESFHFLLKTFSLPQTFPLPGPPGPSRSRPSLRPSASSLALFELFFYRRLRFLRSDPFSLQVRGKLKTHTMTEVLASSWHEEPGGRMRWEEGGVDNAVAAHVRRCSKSVVNLSPSSTTQPSLFLAVAACVRAGLLVWM